MASTEDTIGTLEKSLPHPAPPPELGSIRDHITPELLDNREALFRELAAGTDLPYWARKDLHDEFLKRCEQGDGGAVPPGVKLC